MSSYRCHDCARNRGDLSALPTDLTGSQYQVGKFAKHTTIPGSGRTGLISTFDPGDFAQYADYCINAHASGSAEYRANGSLNAFVWAAGRSTGLTFLNGSLQPVAPDAVKLVLLSNATKLHAYPTGSAVFAAATCVDCRNPVVT